MSDWTSPWVDEGPHVVSLQAELVGRADSAEEFARLARAWLVDAATDRFGELVAALPAGRVLRRRQELDPFGVLGPAGVTWATVHVQRDPVPYEGKAVLYSGRAWQETLDGLADAYPFETTLYLTPLDAEGKAVNHWASAVVGVRRHRDDPRWIQFHLAAPRQYVPWSNDTTVQDDWVGFVERWSERLDAAYGHLTDDATVLAGTALEATTYTIGIDPPTVPRSRDLLRGYSWVTVIAPELVQRLGGVAALTASGAFHRVRELSGGQVLVRATPTLEQFEGDAVERVFRVLAPVLLPGRVPPERAWPGARLLAGVDAADYR